MASNRRFGLSKKAGLAGASRIFNNVGGGLLVASGGVMMALGGLAPGGASIALGAAYLAKARRMGEEEKRLDAQSRVADQALARALGDSRLKSNMPRPAGANPPAGDGKAYIDAAAERRAGEAAKHLPLQLPGAAGAARPAAQQPQGDGQTEGYSRVDSRTGMTVQVQGYRTPRK